MLGKPHHHHAPDVSSPVLHYTNAVQRNDLQTVAATTTSDQHASDPRTISLLGLQRPRTSEGRDRRPNLRIAIPPMDDLPLPPVIHDGGYESDGSNLIGIALGSPRLVHRKNGAQAEQQHHENEKRHNHPALEKPKRPLQRKPSKWRKIGGLFKHKNAAPNQVRNHKHKPPGCGGEPDSGVEDKGNCFGGGTGGKIKSCLEAKRRLKAENANASASANAKSAARDVDASKGDNTPPMLEVDIPDAQMERYSVMFGGLFGQGKPGFLTRRSKTMDEVVASSRINGSPETQRPRPATSPTRFRTPSFSLFPTTQVSKASKVLGTSNIPRGPSPLARSQTLPTGQEQESLLNAHSPLPSPMSFKSRTSEVSSNIASNDPQKTVDINVGKDTIFKDANPFSDNHNDNDQKLPKALSINTELEPQSPNTHNASTASSPVLSPLDATRDKVNSILSPATTPNEIENENKNDNKAETQDPEPENDTENLPKIEISVARSVSVSKSKKKQVLVPIRPRNDQLTPDSLGNGERKGKTPQVMGGYFGHRPGTSQDVRIESVLGACG